MESLNPSKVNLEGEFKESFNPENLHTLTIKKVSKKIFKALLILATIATLASMASISIVYSPLTITFLAISTVALSILLTIKLTALAYPHLPHPLQKTLQAIRSLGTEGIAILACIALYPFKVSRSDPKEIVSAKAPPVLLIHGFLHNSSFSTYYKYRLEDARRQMENQGLEVKFGPLFSIDLGSPLLSFEDYLVKIDQKILEIQQSTGCSEVILIGHSMGGDLAALYSQSPQQRLKIKKVVTIGSPLRGTEVAIAAFFSKAARQMRRISSKKPSLLNQLKKDLLEKDTGTKYCHIGSTFDLIVPYKDSAWMDENPRAENHRIDGVGHVGLVFSDRVVDRILTFLQSPI